ncbi:hypothetical protein LMG23994_06356 [Cupriavidus pinatubonensis]|uniref:Uncharacterized protein n=1 Tax=Cupriavidus pinatubonensis TaxID=248026 RepID=A0ABM8Y1U5_9BURK|nr:hypothetical protein LMG23994_06356 [Cupriavidus pinatubonensis]
MVGAGREALRTDWYARQKTQRPQTKANASTALTIKMESGLSNSAP